MNLKLELSLQLKPNSVEKKIQVKDWRYLHQLQVWPPGGATCIATLPEIALLTSSDSNELVSSSARVTSVKSAQGTVCFRHSDS